MSDRNDGLARGPATFGCPVNFDLRLKASVPLASAEPVDWSLDPIGGKWPLLNGPSPVWSNSVH